jgi:hypothetical protein
MVYNLELKKVERMGFEPTVPCSTHAFQACSLNHSDTSLYGFGTAKKGKKTDIMVFIFSRIYKFWS